jgi:hypothetical protein
MEVPDARAFLEELAAWGIRVAYVAEFEGTYGAFILDNAGNVIEIFQNA